MAPPSRTVLVTGAASGIGRACAVAFGNAGDRLVLADRDPAVRDLAAQVASAGGSAVAVVADVSVPDDVDGSIGRAISAEAGLDVAVNAAGIGGPRLPVHEIPLEEWDRTVGVNLRGLWLCMRLEIAAMRRGGRGGAIVNVASVGGLVGYASAGAYVASKHGVIGLTRTAAIECAAAGIRVNAVCPGAVRTPLLETYATDGSELEAMAAARPAGRLGTPEEVAAAVVWLASDAAGFVVGESLVLDGGLLAGASARPGSTLRR